jgi:hypothetical protein
MIGFALGSIFLVILLKLGGKEGDSELSTAMLASILLWVVSMILSFLMPPQLALLGLLLIAGIAVLTIRKFCMLSWGKSTLFGFLYIVFQFFLALVFR